MDYQLLTMAKHYAIDQSHFPISLSYKSFGNDSLCAKNGWFLVIDC